MWERGRCASWPATPSIRRLLPSGSTHLHGERTVQSFFAVLHAPAGIEPVQFAAKRGHQHRELRWSFQRDLLQHRRHYHERACLLRELQRAAGAVDTPGRTLVAVRSCLHLFESDGLRGQRRRVRLSRDVIFVPGIFPDEPRCGELRSHQQPAVLGDLHTALRSRPEVGQLRCCIVDLRRLPVERPAQPYQRLRRSR